MGPIAAALAGGAIGAAGGGLVGALVGYGIPEEQAKNMRRVSARATSSWV